MYLTALALLLCVPHYSHFEFSSFAMSKTVTRAQRATKCGHCKVIKFFCNGLNDNIMHK